MNIKIVATAVSLLVAAIFMIATSSIGTECYNMDQNKTLKTEKKDSFNFLVINLVSAIVLLLLAIGSIYLGVTSPP